MWLEGNFDQGGIGVSVNMCYKKQIFFLIEWRTTILSNPQKTLWSWLQVGWLLPTFPATVLAFSCYLGIIINCISLNVESLCLDDQLYRHTFLEAFWLLSILITLFTFWAVCSDPVQSFCITWQTELGLPYPFHHWTSQS